MSEISINVEALDREYKTRADQVFKALSDKQREDPDVQALGMQAATADGVADTFCAAWPQVKSFINIAMRGLAFFYPEKVAMVRGVIRTIEVIVIPAVCGGSARAQ